MWPGLPKQRENESLLRRGAVEQPQNMKKGRTLTFEALGEFGPSFQVSFELGIEGLLLDK